VTARNTLKWTASLDVRTTYSKDGAVLFDVKKGVSYSLNLVAAKIWTIIESSPSGITSDGIVDALEIHFQISRRQLEEDTSNWLDKLQRLNLVVNSTTRITNSS
jgi:hypothetical protein